MSDSEKYMLEVDDLKTYFHAWVGRRTRLW